MKPPSVAEESTAGSLVIGVDGGGTKIEAALARVADDGSWRILARSTAGPGNLQSLPLKSIGDHLRQAIGALLAGQPGQPTSVSAIAFSMAGACHEPLRKKFEAWAADEGLAEQVVVTHDARAVIEAGTTDGCGVALIAGTGSVAYARTLAGVEARCGGWGSRFGDEGSAHWIAMEALRAAAWAIDGRGPKTRLVDALAAWLNCADPPQWPALVRSLQPDAIAAAAPLVSRLAEDDDAVAAGLVLRCAEHLAQLIVSLAQRHFAGAPVEVALAGGLILRNSTLRQAVLERVAAAGVLLGGCRDVPHPVEGAVRMATRAVSR